MAAHKSLSQLCVAFLSLFLLFSSTSDALPQRTGGKKKGGQTQTATQKQTAQQQAAQIPGGISAATDGSMILDQTVNINGFPIRYKISGPTAQFTTTSGVTGGTTAPGTAGTMGINVLLHGDGGQSFFDFPNQAVQANTMGVAVLAPDQNLFWGGGSGLNRPNGTAHAQAVSDLITTELPKVMAFDMNQTFFTGVSGGSLLMSGFFIPQQMAKFAGTGVLLNCGAMPPQGDFVDAANVLSTTKIHYQSTQNELALLQPSIPSAITAYEQLATQAGMSAAQINALQTVNNAPQGGHCAFDGQEFVSGVQLMANSYSNIMQGGDGQVAGIGNVLTGVVGNEKLSFGQPERKRALGMLGK